MATYQIQISYAKSLWHCFFKLFIFRKCPFVFPKHLKIVECCGIVTVKNCTQWQVVDDVWLICLSVTKQWCIKIMIKLIEKPWREVSRCKQPFLNHFLRQLAAERREAKLNQNGWEIFGEEKLVRKRRAPPLLFFPTCRCDIFLTSTSSSPSLLLGTGPWLIEDVLNTDWIQR